MKSKSYENLQKILGGLVRFIFRVHGHNVENEPGDGEGQYIIVDDMNKNKSKTFHNRKEFDSYLRDTLKTEVTESMKLTEAMEVLKENGFICEK